MHFLEAFNFSTLLHFQGHFDLSLHGPYSTLQRDLCPGNIVSSISLGVPFVSVIRCLSVHKDKREEAMTEILIWPVNMTEKTLQETAVGESAQLYSLL